MAVLGLGVLWFLVQLIRGPRKRLWIPALVILFGLGLMSAPAAIVRQLPVDLGPLERIVDGQRHITLTGWDGDSYDILEQKPDTVVLQMANSDVDDDTLQYISGMQQLEQLDINDSAITDNGLEIIAGLSNLERLFLRGTRITDEGFRKFILPHEKLRQINLKQTSISKELIDQWKAAGKGRRALR